MFSLHVTSHGINYVVQFLLLFDATYFVLLFMYNLLLALQFSVMMLQHTWICYPVLKEPKYHGSLKQQNYKATKLHL